jgi:hypothetical protein
MALTKETVVDKIEVLENGAVLVRRSVRIIENGKVISQTYHRHALSPGDGLDNEDSKVVAIANAAWTPEVLAAYEAQQEANRLNNI